MSCSVMLFFSIIINLLLFYKNFQSWKIEHFEVWSVTVICFIEYGVVGYAYEVDECYINVWTYNRDYKIIIIIIITIKPNIF